MNINKNPLFQEHLFKIRDSNTTAKEFRYCISKIGEYLALEAAQELATKTKSIKTNQGKEASHKILDEKPILIAILRAGLMIYEGVKKIFPDSDTGFLGEMRNEQTLLSKIGYNAIPNVSGKTVILCETMIATGGSLLEAIKLIEG